MNIRPIRGVWLALLAASTLCADTSYTFQNGAGGYVSASDFSINTQYAQYNGGNGVRWTGDAELACYSTTGADAYAVRYLLKFGGLAVPAGSNVVSATLTLTFDSWESGPGDITGFYLKNGWNAASKNMGWVHRDNSSDWAAGGASAAGTDTVAGKSFQVPALHAVGIQTVTIALDAGQVQEWIDAPASNQGIMLVNNRSGEIIRLVSTAGTQKRRPKLTIVTVEAPAVVSVAVSPASATVQTGGTQQFTATVTGTANTAVTWSATGGTIGGTGLFTAGTSAGAFTVKATSVADPTKSATASVTVPAPVVVSVAVSPASATVQTGGTQQFTATVTGTANTAVTWSATGGTIGGTGLFTAGTSAGTFTVKATSVADPTKSAASTVTIATPTSNLPPVPRQNDGAYVVVQSPVSGMHFTAPATMRIYADPFDINAADPDGFTVNFLVNGQSVGTFTGSAAQNGYFPLTVNNLAAGTYTITARMSRPRTVR